MTCAVPPTARAPSWTPFHENSLKDLSSSWPMSVTMPIFGPPLPVPGVPAPPQAETMSAMSRVRTSDRFMCGLDPPLPCRPRGSAPSDGPRVRHPATDDRQRGGLMRRRYRPLVEPDDVHDEGGVEDAERGQLAASDRSPGPQIELQEQARDDRDDDGRDGRGSEHPIREPEAHRDRDARLEDHRAADVAHRQGVLALPDP